MSKQGLGGVEAVWSNVFPFSTVGCRLEVLVSGRGYGLLAAACFLSTLALLCRIRILGSAGGGGLPGPWGLPVLGVLPFLGRRPHLTVQRWWERYGDIVGVQMGSRLVVIVSGVEAMKECFVRQGDTFSGRPWSYLKKLTMGKGLVFSEGEVWREHRRFTLGCLRDFGMGRVVLEEKVQEEAGYVIDVISGHEGKAFDPAECITKGVSNIISSLVYGSRFDYEDPVFVANLTALAQSTRGQTLISLVNFLPVLEFLPKVLPADKMLLRNVRLRQRYAREQLRSHRETFVRDDPRDFIDAYLARLEELRERGEKTTLDESQLERAIQDLYIAGTETVSVTLRWALLFMAIHTDVQTKVQAELDLVIGSTRKPSRRDRPSLPFTQATIFECQRRGNVALFSVPRCTTVDTTVCGRRIPRGTWVFANRWGLHASERYWKDPTGFRPENFLDDRGNVRLPEAFAPFGIGPRSCLGSSLAQTELFIFFTSVLQSFSLRLPTDRPAPSLEPRAGLNMAPENYELIATRR